MVASLEGRWIYHLPSIICNQVMAWMAKAATIVARRQAQLSVAYANPNPNLNPIPNPNPNLNPNPNQAQLSVAVSAAAENEKLLQHAGEQRGGGGRSSGATLRHLFAYGGEAEREADALQLAAVRVVEVDPNPRPNPKPKPNPTPIKQVRVVEVDACHFIATSRVGDRITIAARVNLCSGHAMEVSTRVRVRVGVGVRARVGLVHGRAAQRHLGPALTALSLQPHAWAGGRDGVRRRRERQRPSQDQSRLPHARGTRRARATLPAPRRRRGRRRGAHTTLIPGHVPYHHACLTTTLATIQEQALQDAALVRRKLRALTRTLTRRRSLRRSEAGRGRWCGGGATLTGVSKA